MTKSSTFTRKVRTGIAAIIIASSSALAVAPAQAGASFGFQFGNGNAGVQLAHYQPPRYQQPRRNYCDNNRQIRRKFRNNGYRNINFVRNRGKWVVVRADRGAWNFKYRVNRCNGRVIEVNRTRNWPNNWGNNNGPGGYYGGSGGNGNWTWQFQYNF
ncbi:MAG: hypothetical protein GXP01_00035 [Alphaproteobacteria bacterium]|nr:hypothetical protein [Alphaproteobacteria bacterium]